MNREANGLDAVPVGVRAPFQSGAVQKDLNFFHSVQQSASIYKNHFLTMKPNHSIPILMICGINIMHDFHLAKLYGVETRALKQQVRRNIRRFPPDFMFELNVDEANWLVSQFVIPEIKVLGGAFPNCFRCHSPACQPKE